MKKYFADTAYSLIQTFKTVFLMQNAVCKFEPSCSNYARDAFLMLPFHKAVVKIVWRVLRCNPMGRGGFDPVKPVRAEL